MKLKTIIWCISSLLLVAYLVAIFFWVGDAFRGSQCTGMETYVADTATNHFVTIPEISREIDSLPSRCQGMLLRDINTDSIEKKLNSIDKIESASCVKLNNGKVIVSVNPMRPVARVFEKEVSYYINCEGKRISADARYFLDVPVISGQFDSDYNMPHAHKCVNTRSSETEIVGTNGVHPMVEGYYQIADAVYRNMIKEFCQD
jgi:hypothetical protein